MNKNIGFKAIVFYIGLMMITWGCRMVDPPADPAVAWMPPDWAEQEQAEEPLWDSIREKSGDLSRPLSITDCIDLALKNSPVTRLSWAAARAAAAEVGQAESYLYPQVSVSGDGTYLKQEYSMKDAVASGNS
ncbi:MAG: TolC family protein, partial [Candidatus Auribacterota bacterium]|nr:TolC family protein [Candidatus Auribacterota bacterium]